VVSTDLVAMKRQMRSFIFTEKVQNVTILDPNLVMNTLTAADYMDPVHLTAAGYEKLAARIVQGSPPDNSTDAERSAPPVKKARPANWGGSTSQRGSNRGVGGRGGRGGRMGGRGGWRARGGHNFSF